MPRPSAPALSLRGAPDLPSWAAAVPLWAVPSWLWITVLGDSLRFQAAGPSGTATAGRARRWPDLPLDRTYPLLVLEYWPTAAPPEAWWPALAGALAGKGLLFVCGLRRRGLPQAIARTAPPLQPAGWHLIEPGPEGCWRLRPARASFRRLLDRQIEPPESARAWLARTWPRLRPGGEHVACLPIWRPGRGP